MDIEKVPFNYIYGLAYACSLNGEYKDLFERALNTSDGKNCWLTPEEAETMRTVAKSVERQRRVNEMLKYKRGH